MPGDGFCLVSIARVEAHLAAAGLRFGKIDGDAETFQHFDGGHARVRVDHIHDTGHEQRDTFALDRGPGSVNWHLFLTCSLGNLKSSVCTNFAQPSTIHIYGLSIHRLTQNGRMYTIVSFTNDNL